MKKQKINLIQNQIPNLHKREWVIIGGGDSLTTEDIELAKEWKAKDPNNRGLIAVTKSFKLNADFDVVHARDARFWKHFYEEALIKTEAHLTTYQEVKGCEHLQKIEIDRLREGGNSGFQAMLIAMMHGAKKIYLLGIDMHHTNNKTHWHEGYPSGLGNSLEKLGTMGSVFKRWMIKFEQLNHEGVKIVNCSMPSKLTCYPKRPFRDCV